MKKIVLSLLLLCSFVFAQTGIHVEAYDEQMVNNRQVTLRLRVVNSTNETFNNVRLVYYMQKEEGRTLNVQPYYVPSATISQNAEGEQVEIYIDIPTLAPGVFPNNSGMSIGINYTDWQPFDKTASLSYPNSNSFITDENISIYIDGQPYSVVGPIVTTPAAPRFVGLQPETSTNRSAWVEISNFDAASNSLQGFTVSDASNHTVALSGDLPKGQKLIICKTNTVQCPAADIQIFAEDLDFGVEGELVIYNAENEPVDYLAWGKQGPNAATVKAANADLNTDDFLATHAADFAFNSRVYKTSDFYRVVSESPKQWRLFYAKEIAKPIEWLADPDLQGLSDGSIVTLFDGEDMVFSWFAVKDAQKYAVTVINDNTDEVVANIVTTKTNVSVHLDPGTYKWTVEASTADDNFSTSEFLIAGKADLFGLTVNTRVFSDEGIVNDLHVDPLAARKDSYLLDLQWGQFFNQKKGGTPHNLSASYNSFHQLTFSDAAEQDADEEEVSRNWIVSAVMLNHYYGGNITQDEIKMRVLNKFGDPILDAFPHGTAGQGSVAAVEEALTIALNVTNADLNFIDGRPDEATLNAALAAGTPIYIWQDRHVMTIDAARLDPNVGKVEYRFINVDNNGTYQWLTYENQINVRGAWIPANVTQAQNTDPSITRDSDGDGVYDFDENNRFHTVVNDDDSDDDLVKDREEILSYTLRQTNALTDYIVYEPLADVDGDGLRAENDPDSDNGGVIDGEEDLNQNGIFEDGETDPFFANDDPSSQIEPIVDAIPGIYGISTLVYREHVNCVKVDGSYCDLASAGNQANVHYPLIVGNDNHVGALHSAATIYFQYGNGGVTIHNGINLYGNASVSNQSTPYWYLVGGEMTNHTMDEFNQVFPTSFDLAPFQNSGDLILDNNNQTATLVAGETYRMIKVSAGTTLHIPAGEFWANDVYLDEGGHIVFDDPTANSTLHVDGNISWRASVSNTAEEILDVAAHFEVIVHSSNRDYWIDRAFAGKFVAPFSSVHVGQTTAMFYGSLIAKNVEIMNFANITVVPHVTNQ